MTFNEFKTYIETNKPPEIRKGQAIMTALSKIWEKEYIRISSVHYYDQTNIDCFYNDNLIPNTLAHLEKVWKNFPY
jgi:hypothetical protein